ncbi:hypothetical protein KP003_14385 [Geomonas nitrogeniifigens]|uniref:hypothetical protein n=1 Tax=Geomonas diazotrophica TaxID=2843197 RepID=UPI001C2C6E91|nr:hypothetical protein [Geomonas nitrogeniifigens]QXE85565.1 hypothetical protein KP003_14385 [Geomonas nitrogeniifigens]
MRISITDITEDKIAVMAPFNVLMTERARELEGKWQQQWIFHKSKEAAVQAALDEIYLLPTNRFVSIRITAKTTITSEGSMVCFFGFPVAKKITQAKVPIPCPGVKRVSAKMYCSASKVTIEKGSIFVMHEMSLKWLDMQSAEWEIEQFGEATSDDESLTADIERMEQRLAALKQLKA